jgi:DNA-binding beta-propeller fold protein YncE
VALYRLDAAGGSAALLRTVQVGAVPDAVVFTPDNSRVLVAIKGEPTDDYEAEPAGGVVVIDVATGEVRFPGFGGFDTETHSTPSARAASPSGRSWSTG